MQNEYGQQKSLQLGMRIREKEKGMRLVIGSVFGTLVLSNQICEINEYKLMSILVVGIASPSLWFAKTSCSPLYLFIPLHANKAFESRK